MQRGGRRQGVKWHGHGVWGTWGSLWNIVSVKIVKKWLRPSCFRSLKVACRHSAITPWSSSFLIAETIVCEQRVDVVRRRGKHEGAGHKARCEFKGGRVMVSR